MAGSQFENEAYLLRCSTVQQAKSTMIYEPSPHQYPEQVNKQFTAHGWQFYDIIHTQFRSALVA